MDIRNKIFKDNKTGETVKVIDSFENIAILENKQKIDVRRLTNPQFYTEEIDPKQFFNNQGAYNILAEKIKNIPANQIKDEEDAPLQQIEVKNSNYDSFMPQSTDSAILMSTEDDERAELARKYGANMTSDISKQNEAFAKLLGDDATDLPVVTSRPVQSEFNEPPIQRVEVNREINLPPQNQPTTMIDPVTQMFKNVKRNLEFKISLEIENKIPRLDFIEMMEDSYEVSIIDFLAEEFTNNILRDPAIIKNKIKDKINQLVYEKSSKIDNSQITDSVTQVNHESSKKTSRNPKPNTSQGEKPGYKKPTRTKKESTKND